MEFHERIEAGSSSGAGQACRYSKRRSKDGKEIYDQFAFRGSKNSKRFVKRTNCFRFPVSNKRPSTTYSERDRSLSAAARKLSAWPDGADRRLDLRVSGSLTPNSVAYAGSLRRMKEIVHDVDILAASLHPEETMKAFLGLPIIEVGAGSRRDESLSAPARRSPGGFAGDRAR